MPPEWHTEALRLAEADPTLSAGAIAKILDKPRSSVWRALNPGYVRTSDQMTRRGDQRRRRTRYRGRCEQCGLPMGAGSRGRRVRCAECEKKRRREAHERALTRVERWYKAGLTYAEMSERAGWKNRSVPTYYVKVLIERGRVQPRRRSAT